MRIKKVIEMELDESFADWDFLFFTDPETGNKENSKEDTKGAAKAWKVSEQFVKDVNDAFDMMRDQLVECLKSDLKDIWEAATE